MRVYTVRGYTCSVIVLHSYHGYVYIRSLGCESSERRHPSVVRGVWAGSPIVDADTATWS